MISIAIQRFLLLKYPRDTAQKIADELKALIGIDFLVSRDVGLGVNPGEKRVTYFVQITD